MIVIKHDFKGRDNQDELATWHNIFQRSSSPHLNFARQNQVWMDVIFDWNLGNMIYIGLITLRLCGFPFTEIGVVSMRRF